MAQLKGRNGMGLFLENTLSRLPQRTNVEATSVEDVFTLGQGLVTVPKETGAEIWGLRKPLTA